jgi:hypothetical protein
VVSLLEVPQENCHPPSFVLAKNTVGRSKWPRVLRCGSSAARLLRLGVRIPPGHGSLSVVSVVCCQVEVSASGQSLVQRGPTECCVSECHREALIMSHKNILYMVRSTNHESPYCIRFSSLLFLPPLFLRPTNLPPTLE